MKANQALKNPLARILVVDDDAAMCQLLTDLLCDDGYSVEVANDGDAAIEKFQSSSFALTITDLMMPRMKGTELVRRLREIDNGALSAAGYGIWHHRKRRRSDARGRISLRD